MSNPTPESASTSPGVFIPTFPFVSANADVILRSSEGADFYVQRGILALVSPVFCDMFTLPQPEASPGIPVIPVQEDAPLLDRALRFFYPGAQPVVATLDELRGIIEVLVEKYDVQCVVPAAKQRLETYMATQPLAVFAVAVTYEWKDVASKAARESLKLRLRVPDAEASPELKDISAATYHNLLHYHYSCGLTVKDVTEGLQWVTDPNDLQRAGKCIQVRELP
ncbi:hypothetical protein B0H11DRAFT_2096543 [Mycena galericulata]|nr:hypothetical protein B0H11DRAFT_2096543 [Mycena galericulata]